MRAEFGRIGVIVVNFGEPEEPTPEHIVPFLERIFLQNMGLEPDESALERTRELARDRAPGLIEEYEEIGGSPLNRQAVAQADEIQEALHTRYPDAKTYAGFQFTEPFVRDAVARAKADGVDTLVALPVYPICGRSTTVAALEDVRQAMADLDWSPRFVGVSGWHHHDDYEALRADHIADFVFERGLDLGDPDTLLYFSVHGTPIKYLDEGSRYDRYVEEHCRAIAARLGVDRYTVGFQNHTNRRVQWTRPDNEDEIESRPERRLVVVPIAFMHEQSETLAELDGELREFTEGLGKEFHRVPVPHGARAFSAFLAGLTDRLVVDAGASGSPRMARCRCAPIEGVVCANAMRSLPPSPYAMGVAAS